MPPKALGLQVVKVGYVFEYVLIFLLYSSIAVSASLIFF